MIVSVVAAQRADRALLDNLFQFYHYDMTSLLGGHVGPDGRFSAPALDAYWQDPWRFPMLIRVDGHVVGFALIHHRSRLTDDTETWDVAEFFVMQHARRRGVGTAAALDVFSRFRGRWEVRQLRANVPATQFWRRVIGRHRGDAYTETVHDDDRWRGPVQRFDNTCDP